jgi:ATP-dependent DNA helicase RecQ
LQRPNHEAFGRGSIFEIQCSHLSIFCFELSVKIMLTVVQEATRDADIRKALSSYWGFDTLRPLQREVVESALDNRDAVVVMPTGGGKSLCFQLPAVVSDRLTVVVSPLIALMKDQIDGLSVIGVPAAALNSSMSSAEESEIRRKVTSGAIRLLYVSPERLLASNTLQLLANADNGRGVARFAIDEAHCISAWGHDFRTEFRQLSRIKEAFPGTPVQAFTATATPQVQRDIAIQLKLERPRRFVGIFDRPNLTYRVVAKDEPLRRIAEAVRRYPDEGVIVYSLSRKDTETVANGLKAQGISAVAYHAGLSPDVRAKVSEDFAQERVNVVAATIAFGMGIDRANVRCVVHECLPKSMEGYQQETGRAGRDGLPSECVLLYSLGDVMRLKRLLSDGESSTVDRHMRFLDEVRRFATSHQCRHKTLSEHFGQAYELSAEGCGACDVCLGGMADVANSNAIGRRILETALELSQQRRGFGAGYLAAVLAGSRVKQVVERQGDQAAGFGSLSGESSDRISTWIHQLADFGLLEISEGQYPMVSVSAEGRAVLDSGSPIELRENVALIPKATSKTDSIDPNADPILYEKLRVWRREKATEKGVPAYVIFHDATLARLSAIRPSTRDGLRAVSGMGDRRADEFGKELLALIAADAAVRGVALDQSFSAPKPVTSSAPKNSSYWVFFHKAMAIEEIVHEAGVKPTTIWSHLSSWVEVEKPDSISAWVDVQTQATVSAALDAVGGELLKPVFEYLDGAVPYEKIRLVRAFRNSRDSKSETVI